VYMLCSLLLLSLSLGSRPPFKFLIDDDKMAFS
jgi:hypothetical protein